MPVTAKDHGGFLLDDFYRAMSDDQQRTFRAACDRHDHPFLSPSRFHCSRPLTKRPDELRPALQRRFRRRESPIAAGDRLLGVRGRDRTAAGGATFGEPPSEFDARPSGARTDAVAVGAWLPGTAALFLRDHSGLVATTGAAGAFLLPARMCRIRGDDARSFRLPVRTFQFKAIDDQAFEAITQR